MSVNWALENLPKLPPVPKDQIDELVAELQKRIKKKKLPKVIYLSLFLMLGSTLAHADLSSNQINSLAEKIIKAESSGRAHIVGDGGKSRGLMQIQKATWELHTDKSWDLAFDPKLNKEIGLRELKRISKKYGKRATPALITYTYNTGRFLKAGKELPKWTVRHPNLIYRRIFKEAFYAEQRRGTL